MLKIGYKASAEQFGPVELLKYGVLAEQAGFDSVFISDHFQPWRHTGGHAPFAMAWLGALGASTSRIAMGTSVLTPTFRYHPSIVAQCFGTLGCMFPGRVILGVGTGESLNEVPATGIPWPEPKERFARLRESVRLMRTLWTEERVTFDGEYYKTENATIYDRPEVPVPIYVSAGGAQVAKFAGRMGDGFINTSGKAREFYTETLLPNVDAGLEAAGRPREACERMIEMKVSFDTDLAARHGRHPALGGAGAVAGGEAVGGGPARDGAAGRCAAGGTRGEALDRLERCRRACRAHPALCRDGVPAPGVPRAGAGPGAVHRSVREAGDSEAAADRRLMPESADGGASLSLYAVPGLKMIAPGDDLAAIILEGLAKAGFVLRDGDLVAVAQKIVSKAEGRYVDLGTVTPSAEAVTLAAAVAKDPRFVEVVLSESRRVVRHRPDLLIVEHRDGYIMANAGIDHSNIDNPGKGDERVLLLPQDADAAAASLREALERGSGCRLAVLINDSFGRPWRRGTVGVALGAAGLPALKDMRGQPDLFGRTLRVTEIGYADEIAAAASLLMGQAAEGRPVVVVRGLDLSGPHSPGRSLVRPEREDLFR